RHIGLSDEPDVLKWYWTTSGAYSASSCYKALFFGACEDPHWKLTWRPWAPLRVKFFLWLALQDRCWTADRLARHGLPHD
uniref:Reverse transcriptase zinc-binding domain-containing protein n=1 Tax=Aegilops tauschii subsp. strangulata TaxID=200361 RepID=A0A453J5F7_AEGTS